MTFQVNTTQWLELSREMRDKLTAMFNIPKTGKSVVFGSKVLSDGYTEKNLQAITIERLNYYLGANYQEVDILKAFHELIIKLENEQNEPIKSPEAGNNDAGTNQSSSGEADTNGQDSTGVQTNTENTGGQLSSSLTPASSKTPRGRKAKREVGTSSTGSVSV